MLGGVTVITGKWRDGSPLLAIPNFARMNRDAPPHDYPDDHQADPRIRSKVWI
jgi:hypothetical protein